MSDAAPVQVIARKSIVVLPLTAAGAWCAPWLLDASARRIFGATLFDRPWTVLHLADMVTAVSLLAALVIIVAVRRAGQSPSLL